MGVRGSRSGEFGGPEERTDAPNDVGRICVSEDRGGSGIEGIQRFTDDGA